METLSERDIVDETFRWFCVPSAADLPEHHRIDSYIALTTLIVEEFMKINDELSHTNKVNIHHLFTYLLLGWNPHTGVECKHHQFAGLPLTKEDPSSKSAKRPTSWAGEFEVFTDKINATYIDLLDYSKPVGAYDKYILYTQLIKANDVYRGGTSSVRRNLVIGEDSTLLMAACYLLNRGNEIKSPTDRMSAMACVELYRRHLSSAPARSREDEYAGFSLDYEGWFVNQIERLFSLHLSMDEIVPKLTYFAIFSMAIRAYRSLGELKSELGNPIKDFITSQMEACNRLLDVDIGVKDIAPESGANVTGKPVLVKALRNSSIWKPKR